MANRNWLPSDYVKAGWCQGAGSRNAEGREVRSAAPDAVSWCLTGGITASSLVTERGWLRMTDAIREIVGKDITGWNDAPGRTQGEVVELLERVEALVL